MLMILLALALALAYPVELDLDLIKGNYTERLVGPEKAKIVAPELYLDTPITRFASIVGYFKGNPFSPEEVENAKLCSKGTMRYIALKCVL